MNKCAELLKAFKRWISNYGLLHDVALPDEQRVAEYFGLDPNSAFRLLKELELDGYCRRRACDGQLIVAVQDWSQSAPLVSSLPAALYKAFHQEDVTIDMIGFTGETFWASFKGLLEKVRSEEKRLRSLHIRLMVPNFKNEVAVPSVVGDPDNPSARKRQDEISKKVLTLLRSIKDLQTDDFGRHAFRVTLQIGKIDHFSPMDKSIILNRSTVLRGKYKVLQAQVMADDQLMEINDLRGFDVPLRTSTEESNVEETLEQFNTWWENLASIVEI
jgi:hypothetical protein